MTYNLEWLIDNFEKGKRNKFLFFWGYQKSKSGELISSCFSQWWTSPFIVENVRYNTAEHWMMAQKALLFNDREIYEKIIVAKSPAEAKALGRQVSNFNEATWNSKRFDIVVKGSLAKFTQHKDLKEFLLNTKEKILVEASPVDRIWGIGLTAESEEAENPKRWNGLNLLGFALMEVRDIIRNRMNNENKCKAATTLCASGESAAEKYFYEFGAQETNYDKPMPKKLNELNKRIAEQCQHSQKPLK